MNNNTIIRLQEKASDVNGEDCRCAGPLSFKMKTYSGFHDISALLTLEAY
jgi:hypothetical protein